MLLVSSWVNLLIPRKVWCARSLPYIDQSEIPVRSVGNATDLIPRTSVKPGAPQVHSRFNEKLVMPHTLPRKHRELGSASMLHIHVAGLRTQVRPRFESVRHFHPCNPTSFIYQIASWADDPIRSCRRPATGQSQKTPRLPTASHLFQAASQGYGEGRWVVYVSF